MWTPPFQLAAIDLDGTLLGADKQISPANLMAVTALREYGVRVVLASGRRHERMLPFHRQLGLDTPLISSQGALVRETGSGRDLYRRFLPSGLACQIAKEAAAEEGSLLYFTPAGVYISRRTVHTDLFQTRNRQPLIECWDLRRFAGPPPEKIIWVDSPARTAARLPWALSRYGGGLEVTVTSPEYLVFTARGANKAAALQAVAAHYGIGSSAVVAFGDGNNDVPMFQWAGLGVAMSTATPQAQAAADLVAPHGDARSSLARAIAQVLSPALRHAA